MDVRHCSEVPCKGSGAEMLVAVAEEDERDDLVWTGLSSTISVESRPMAVCVVVVVVVVVVVMVVVVVVVVVVEVVVTLPPFPEPVPLALPVYRDN